MAIKSITRKVVRTERPTDLSTQLDRSNPLNRGLYKALLFGDTDQPIDLLNSGGTSFTGVSHDGNIVGREGPTINFASQKNTGIDSNLYDNSGDFSAIGVVEPAPFTTQNIMFYQGNKIQNGYGGGLNTLEIHFYMFSSSAGFIAQDGSVKALSQVDSPHEPGFPSVLGGVRSGRNVTAFADGIQGPTTDNDADNIATVYIRLADCTDPNFSDRYYKGKQYLFLSWSRALSNEEMKSLTLNPWQVFEPETETIFFSDVAALPVTALFNVQTERLSHIKTATFCPVELSGYVNQLHTVFIEHLQSMIGAFSTLIESLSVIYKDYESSFESISSLARQFPVMEESLSNTSSLSQSNFEGVMGLQNSAHIKTEGINGLVAAKKIEQEAQGYASVNVSHVLSHETVGWVKTDTPIKAESLKHLSTPLEINIDSIVFIQRSSACNIEFMATVNNESIVPIEHLLALSGSTVLSDEALAYIAKSLDLPHESIQDIEVNIILNVVNKTAYFSMVVEKDTVFMMTQTKQ